MNLPVSPSYALLEAKFYSLIQMDRETRNHLHSQKGYIKDSQIQSL